MTRFLSWLFPVHFPKILPGKVRLEKPGRRDFETFNEELAERIRKIRLEEKEEI